jgi:hypothetical protein
VDLSGMSHVNYPVIKLFKLAEQKGSYTPKPHIGRARTIMKLALSQYIF